MSICFEVCLYQSSVVVQALTRLVEGVLVAKKDFNLPKVKIQGDHMKLS